MIFLVTLLSVIEVLPEDGLLLQTYSTDNIGRQNFFFSFGTQGCPYQTLGYKESAILSLKQREIKIAVPFWIRFYEDYFHFFSVPKLVFSHPFCNFIPQQMKLDPIEIFTVRNANLYIQNMRLNEVMVINEIFTNSKNIFIHQIQIIRVMPSQMVLYSIYVCPTEAGNFQDIIFFKTNFGTISYSITYQAYKNQDDTFTPVLIHHYAQSEINISIPIPFEISDEKKSVIYDSSMFDLSKILIKENILFLKSSNIPTSSYITFVHILTAQLRYTFPLTILSSPKPLQHIYPTIIIPPITQFDDTSEAEIIIVNPTDILYEITSVSLTDAPFNVRIEKLLQPVVAQKNSRTVIGHVVVTGDREGEISGSVYVNYINRQMPVKYDMHIPIKSCCYYGSLSFSDKHINLLSNTSKKFSMTNNFKLPIIIFEIKTDSPFFSIGDFEPFILVPGQTSREILVKFNYSSADANCHTNITIVTNITSFHIRGHGLTGKITIHDANNQMSMLNPRRSLLQTDLGKRYAHSIQNFTFIIRNPNPIEFVVNKVKSTPGIKVDCLKSFVVDPDSEFKLNCLVLFKPMEEKMRIDQITFCGTGKSLLVTLTWKPVNGSVTVKYYLPDTLYYGYAYKGNISLYSTFNSTFLIKRLCSNHPSNLTNFYLDEQFTLSPNQTTPAGNITFVLDRDFIRSKSIENLLENEKSYKNIVSNWSDGPYSSKLYIMLQYDESLFLRAVMKFDIYISERENIVVNVGKVVIGSYKNTTIAIPNNYYTSVRFNIYDIEEVKFEDTQFSLENDSIAIVAFLFHGKILGSKNISIPICSNVSAPFYAQILATVVDIKINVFPRELYFEPKSLFQRTIQKMIYVKNKGDTEILLYNFTIRPVSWRPKNLPYIIKTNCTVFLEPNTTCFANVIANSWDLVNASFDFIAQSHMTRKTVRLRSSVGYRIYWKIRLIKKVAWNSLLLIALIYPSYLIVHNLINASKRKKLLDLKLKQLPDEIEKLSAAKSSKFSVATQAVGLMDSTGGVWVKLHYEHEMDLEISNDLINEMKSALKKIE